MIFCTSCLKFNEHEI
ncbi:hypothetical protein A3Q56_04060 [Intoshia linei]|uniref:Uncharacterized protein n=1 Tax=Intoshia linei TaxID=1819745 RepID=A0A177B1P0_9BILA|nr:hypothetical protein A3Q56_04060 [Intoshia linei]